ncbi:Guanine nucleotide exchange factor for Cdc42p [Coemansia sp. RSA 2320]|nr:Guanine nucleotide exchange factor for Cdc42p [Coemansia sp. RSA 2320]
MSGIAAYRRLPERAFHGYMDELQKKNIIPNESARYIFANLNAMVDFQRRFLIGIEANATQPPEDQHFGSVFVNMKEGFMVYEPYCANYTRASKLCIAEEESLKALSHIIEPHYELPSMLIKPVQRLCKYPMIMEELTKFYDKTSPVYAELREGISAINSIVEQVNEAERKEGNLAVVSDLEDRVEDWKGYSINTFGELFLHDSFVMSTTDVKRELLIYLFENILICCKEVNEKERRRNQKHKSNALQLKGRIFLFSIHSVVDTSRDGQLSLTIYWRDVVMENFSLACRTEDQLKLWKSTMERLITRNRERAPPMAEQPQGSPTTLIAHRVGSNQQYGTDYDSDEDTSVQRRGRYSEGSSLTIAMQQDKSSSSLSYRKTYDGAASRGRGGSAKKLAGDYQSELVDGIERSATISTFHRRQGTNGSGSSFGDAADSAPAFQNSPMQGGPYYGKHDVPPVPVPPLHRSTGDSVGRIHSQKAPGTLSIASPIPTAYSSSISPMTPGVAMGHSAMSALSTTGTPVPSLSNSYGLAPPLVAQAKPVKVKVHFQDDIFVIVVKHDLHMDDLVERVERKIKICAGPRVGISSEQDLAAAPPLGIRMKYQDEDGDMISIGSDDDVQLAFESANASRKDESTMSTLNLFVSL